MKTIILQFILGLITLTLSFGQNIPSDSLSSKLDSTNLVNFSNRMLFGNLDGLGMEINYKISSHLSVNGSIGIMIPIRILLGPPFNANQLNFITGMKYYPISWLYVKGGIYIGLYKLTKLFFITTPISSIGFEFGNLAVELGASFNTPTTIYTESSPSEGETIGLGEERLSPSGPTFPFYRISYRLKLTK